MRFVYEPAAGSQARPCAEGGAFKSRYVARHSTSLVVPELLEATPKTEAACNGRGRVPDISKRGRSRRPRGPGARVTCGASTRASGIGPELESIASCGGEGRVASRRAVPARRFHR